MNMNATKSYNVKVSTATGRKVLAISAPDKEIARLLVQNQLKCQQTAIKSVRERINKN